MLISKWFIYLGIFLAPIPKFTIKVCVPIDLPFYFMRMHVLPAEVLRVPGTGVNDSFNCPVGIRK